MSPRLEIHPDPESTAQALARELTARLGQAAEPGAGARLCVCGGSTPARLYELLGASWPATGWARRLELYWGDERYVPAASPLSNYRLVAATLLAGDWLAAPQVHRIPTEGVSSAEEAATEYEAELRRSFGSSSRTFDVALQGLGMDGHTASLFPGRAALAEHERWVRAVPEAGQPPLVPRITLTLPALNRSRCIIVLATGPEKASIVRQALAPVCEGASPLPASQLKGLEETIWFLDAAAAGLVVGEVTSRSAEAHQA